MFFIMYDAIISQKCVLEFFDPHSAFLYCVTFSILPPRQTRRHLTAARTWQLCSTWMSPVSCTLCVSAMEETSSIHTQGPTRSSSTLSAPPQCTLRRYVSKLTTYPESSYYCAFRFFILIWIIMQLQWNALWAPYLRQTVPSSVKRYRKQAAEIC